MVTGEPEQPRKFGLFHCKFCHMNLTIKKGERQVLQLDSKKVVITITSFRLKCKRSMRLKIKAKGISKSNQARL